MHRINHFDLFIECIFISIYIESMPFTLKKIVTVLYSPKKWHITDETGNELRQSNESDC